MSAGGLSYSGLRTSSKVTLPSVEMWGTNMNILKDPPRSIHTRRIDKVGQTQSILEAQDESGDRICEMINVYARGVNPMVSVSYDNYSNNGGASSPLANRAAVSLPYKVENVRPPVFRQEDLLPLSRLPRNWFYSYTNPAFPDLVQAEQCSETDKSVHKTILNPSATTNRRVSLSEDMSVAREAPASAIVGDLVNIRAGTGVSLPVAESLREERDTGGERKSIVVDKMEATARTNPGGPARAGDDHDAIGDGRVRDHAPAISVRSSVGGGSDQHMEKEFIHKDPKQIQMNKRAYEAFSVKNRDIATGHHAVDVVDTQKFINKDKYLCIARTNRTRENFVHPFRGDDTVSSVPTKDFLYKEVQARPTSVFQLSTTTATAPVLPDPLRVSAVAAPSTDRRATTIAHEALSREYRPNPSQPVDVATRRTASIHRSVNIEHLDRASLHDSIPQYAVDSSRRMEGGIQGTEDSIPSFTMNNRPAASAATARTMDGGGDNPFAGARAMELRQKTIGSATTNRTMIGDTTRHDVVTHPIQDVLRKSVEARRTFIGSSADPFQDSSVSLHNDKRTPLHSVVSNTQSPYSRDQKHDVQAEQHRRVLHTQASTHGTDVDQLVATGDVYQIQNREGRVGKTLDKGGFDGQGSAIPVFDQYDNYRQNVSDPTRDNLRHKFQEMFYDRYPSPGL